MGLIIRSLLMIVAAVAVIGGATRALFTDSATVNNNTFSAGTLDISLSNPSGSLPFQVTNWAPGKTTELRLDIKNTGSLPAKVTGTVSGTWDFSGLDGYVNVVDIKYWNGTEWINPATVSGDLTVNAGATLPIKAVVEFDSDADNTYQGKTYRATFTVSAVQLD